MTILNGLNQSTKQRGFTLVEMSIVLVVIGLILGAVSIGKDLQRNAVHQQISTTFIQGWSNAYQTYYLKTGTVIGDSAAAPTLRVDGADVVIDSGPDGPDQICTDQLEGFMDAAGIEMPSGRTEGQETNFVYLDSNGNPQQISVCFESVQWSIPAAVPPGYVVRNRNVMVISNLTPDLAKFLDAQVDGKMDARFGSFRESVNAADVTVPSEEWSRDNRDSFGTNDGRNRDEDQVAVVIGYYLMPF